MIRPTVDHVICLHRDPSPCPCPLRPRSTLLCIGRYCRTSRVANIEYSTSASFDASLTSCNSLMRWGSLSTMTVSQASHSHLNASFIVYDSFDPLVYPSYIDASRSHHACVDPISLLGNPLTPLQVLTIPRRIRWAISRTFRIRKIMERVWKSQGSVMYHAGVALLKQKPRDLMLYECRKINTWRR